MSPAFDLTLPEPERRRAGALASGWLDLLYIPGAGFASPLEPGAYRSSFLIVPAQGPALRVSSFVVPAFGGELCRIRLEPVASYRPESLGSFFEPSRRGLVYAMSGDRRGGAARPPEQPGWYYDGPSLRPRLGDVTRVRRVRERLHAPSTPGWSLVADRGLALTGADGEESLLLAAGDAEEPTLIPTLGLYRALIDPGVTPTPGATVRDLLGYGEWEIPLEIAVELEPC